MNKIHAIVEVLTFGLIGRVCNRCHKRYHPFLMLGDYCATCYTKNIRDGII